MALGAADGRFPPFQRPPETAFQEARENTRDRAESKGGLNSFHDRASGRGEGQTGPTVWAMRCSTSSMSFRTSVAGIRMTRSPVRTARRRGAGPFAVIAEIVAPAVYLDRQPRRFAIEVEDEGTDRMLTAEPDPDDPAIAKPAPQ